MEKDQDNKTIISDMRIVNNYKRSREWVASIDIFSLYIILRSKVYYH